MYGNKIVAPDGIIGSVSDFFFDDETAYIHYLVVRTGTWFLGRLILLSPLTISSHRATKSLSVHVRREQIKKSPPIDLSMPISRQMQSRLHSHYGWPVYWSFSPRPPRAPHLRSTKEIEGYTIQAQDRKIGKLFDLLVDELWMIRYVAVDTPKWMPGKRVLISPSWFAWVDWAEKQLEVDLSREEIGKAPEYDPSALIDRQYEEKLHDFYRRPGYWI
jgi:hypothetical protein